MSAAASGARLRDWAILPLRMIVGYGFMAHGMAKLLRGPAGFAKLLAFVGTPYPLPAAWLVTLLEIFGGLALVIGVFVALTSVPLIASMVVAMLTVQLRYGFSSVNTVGMTPDGPRFGPPGYEINLLYIGALIVIALGGPGALSIEGWWSRRRSEARAESAA